MLLLDEGGLTLDALRDWEAAPGPVALADAARARMESSVAAVQRVVATDRVSYGINTGFGAFANRRISTSQLAQLQYNLVRSHACGTGTPLAPGLVRRMMLLKANSLAAGLSGIRPAVVDALLAMLNADVLPLIPGRGSVGASGDLAPLAHLALALVGEGEAMQGTTRLAGADVMQAAGCAPVQLEAKEGLALLNGTQLSTTLAIEGLFRAENLLGTAITAGALSVEGLAGSYTPFDDRIHAARRLAPQRAIAARFRRLLTDSEIHNSHESCDRVQDPYSVRCMPQVLGAVDATLGHARGVLEAEANGVSDNPLVFGDDVLSGGNFHAAPAGFVADFMAIAVAELANISERRIDLLARRVNPNLNMFLTGEPGVESGFMIAHVTAAALASENKTLAHPASVDTIPTSAGQEDHVSMAPWAGHKLLAACDNTATVLAIELLAAAHAIDEQRPLATTPPLTIVHDRIRACAPFVRGDRRLDRDIATLATLLRAGDFDDRQLPAA
ncbi:histidine ammonia-lyase [Wenzhouxiangella sp. XN24]|uniref:histidine ammonia-lyase n=1 Tax=Wenzhouxiangella sp. XN24 TaxID=2713569 RepID=UPI0013EAA4AD|nr:histidine ammonia-lyase [Wenzhouxiangella sp. XN24]NGX16910.1 histidine ammonia-lyase [Wenzhouxiangella sp. XN24]